MVPFVLHREKGVTHLKSYTFYRCPFFFFFLQKSEYRPPLKRVTDEKRVTQ